MSFKALIAFCLLLFNLSAEAQTKAKSEGTYAALTYNAEKSDQGKLVFDTSFFIFGRQLSEEEKKEKVTRVLQGDPSFRNLELLNANGAKDLMVIVHVEAQDKAALTKKIHFLLETLAVQEVKFQGETVPLDTFSF